jgi:hypothetical protein
MTLAEQILDRLFSLDEQQKQILELIKNLPASRDAAFEAELQAIVEPTVLPLIELPVTLHEAPVALKNSRLLLSDMTKGTNAALGLRLLKKHPEVLGRIIRLRREGYLNDDVFEFLSSDFINIHKEYHIGAIITAATQVRFMVGQTKNLKATAAYRRFIKDCEAGIKV